MFIETSEFMFSVRYKVPGKIGYVKCMSLTIVCIKTGIYVSLKSILTMIILIGSPLWVVQLT